MFWRFGFHTQSSIDVLLEKDNVTLQEVLDEEDVLQECKSPNRKLIDFFTNPTILQQLFKLITDEPSTPPPMETKYRYAMLACEVLVSDVQALNDALVSNEDLLAEFLKFLDRPAPLDPIRTSYFCRVFSLLLQKKTGETLAFLQHQQNLFETALRHIGTSAVIDLLVRIVSCAENPTGASAIKWVLDENLIERLASKFDADLHPDVHGNVAQCFSEIMTLVTTVEVLLPARDPVLDRLRSKETCHTVLQSALKPDGANRVSSTYNALSFLTELIQKHTRPVTSPNPNGPGGPPGPATSTATLMLSALAPLVEAVLPFLDTILTELASDYTPPGELANTSFGQIKPLGSRRLKVVEFLSALSQVESKDVTEHLVKLQVPRRFVELLFKYPLHNFLHYQIYEMVSKAVNGPVEVYSELLVALLRDAALTTHIVEATKENDAELENNNGVRRGYMGYLTQISTDLVKLSERGTLPDEAKGLLEAEQWQDYLSSSYRETRERDTKPLGGQKPQPVDSSAVENDGSMYSSSGSSGRNESDSVQDQMTSSLPTESMINDDDDDDLVDFENEDAHNFRSVGAYSSTYDHNIDIDSDEDAEEEGHMHGDSDFDAQPGNANFANFDDMEFAAAADAFASAKHGNDDDDSSDDDGDERLLSTITRNAALAEAAAELQVEAEREHAAQTDASEHHEGNAESADASAHADAETVDAVSATGTMPVDADAAPVAAAMPVDDHAEADAAPPASA